MPKRMWQRITLWTCGPGFSGGGSQCFTLGSKPVHLYKATVVATWSSGYIRHHVLHQLQAWKATVHSKNMKLKKQTWNRDQKQANYISIHWHCKNNTSANHQALEKTSTQYQSPPSPQNTAYYIEQLRRPHFYHLAHGNRTSVLIHSSLAWLRVHEPNPLWNCKKRKR